MLCKGIILRRHHNQIITSNNCLLLWAVYYSEEVSLRLIRSVFRFMNNKTLICINPKFCWGEGGEHNWYMVGLRILSSLSLDDFVCILFFHHRAIYTLNTPGGSKELLPLRRGIRRASKWSGCLKKARNFKMTQEVKFYKCLKFIALRSLITVSLSQFQRQFNEFSWLRPWHMTALMLMYSSHTETIPAQNTSQSVSTILLIRRNLNLPVISPPPPPPETLRYTESVNEYG